MARWGVDTCGCIIQFDGATPDAQNFVNARFEFKCPMHKKATTVDVHRESQTRMQALQDLVDAKVINEDQFKNILFDPEGTEWEVVPGSEQRRPKIYLPEGTRLPNSWQLANRYGRFRLMVRK